MIRRIMVYLLALVLFWLSYLQFGQIRETGELRFQSGQQLSGWIMYVVAVAPALLAVYAILQQLRKKK